MLKRLPFTILVIQEVYDKDISVSTQRLNQSLSIDVHLFILPSWKTTYIDHEIALTHILQNVSKFHNEPSKTDAQWHFPVIWVRLNIMTSASRCTPGDRSASAAPPTMDKHFRAGPISFWRCFVVHRNDHSLRLGAIMLCSFLELFIILDVLYLSSF